MAVRFACRHFRFVYDAQLGSTGGGGSAIQIVSRGGLERPMQRRSSYVAEGTLLDGERDGSRSSSQRGALHHVFCGRPQGTAGSIVPQRRRSDPRADSRGQVPPPQTGLVPRTTPAACLCANESSARVRLQGRVDTLPTRERRNHCVNTRTGVAGTCMAGLRREAKLRPPEACRRLSRCGVAADRPDVVGGPRSHPLLLRVATLQPARAKHIADQTAPLRWPHALQGCRL